jgi:hypothetical protein
MGLYLDGRLFGNNANPQVVSAMKIVERESIVKVSVDMNKGLMGWHLNDELVYMT